MSHHLVHRNLECKLLRCYYSPKWPFPRSRNPTIMPHTQFVANAKDASLPPIHAGTAQMHRFSVSGRNLVDVKHGSQVHFRRKLRLLDQRHSRWAIAPCLSIHMPLHSPHPSERRGKNNPTFKSFSFQEGPARKHDYNSGLAKTSLGKVFLCRTSSWIVRVCVSPRSSEIFLYCFQIRQSRYLAQMLETIPFIAEIGIERTWACILW